MKDKKYRIDVVILYDGKTEWEHNELRYALRSVEYSLLFFDKLFIIGDCPSFIKPSTVIHIPVENNLSTPSKNIVNKLKIVCNDERISDEFLYFANDYFLLGEMKAPFVPYYYEGDLDDAVLRAVDNNYKNNIVLTNNILKAGNFTNYYHDIHTPFRYRKDKLLDMFEAGFIGDYLIKSMYANLFCPSRFEIRDYKLGGIPTPLQIKYIKDKAPFFSITETPSNIIKEFIEKRYKTKSKFEI